MTVLVVAASKYGATQEIAEAIGRVLSERGLETDVRRIGDVVDLTAYAAVVLGSAVYAGHWLEPARRFVEEHGDELVDRPNWLFSSEPIGDPPRPSEHEAVQIESIMAATRAKEHRVFAGKLDRNRLSFRERALVFAFRAAEGDFRDWDAIAAWASEIADVLQPTGAPKPSAFEQSLCKRVANELCPAREAELLHDVCSVRLGCAHRDVEHRRDLLVRVAERKEAQHFALAV